MKRATILVTGATGRIGRNLLDELSRDHFDVTLLIRDEKIAQKYEKNGFKVIISDITKSDTLPQNTRQFDIVFHLAASLQIFERNNTIRRTNLNGLKNVLHTFCSTNHPTTFIFASSIDVVVRDNDYARSKIEGETIIKRFAKDHPQMKFVIVRIGNVCLPGDNSFGIQDFLKRKDWRACLLFHELGENYLYPIELKSLCRRLVGLLKDRRSLNQTISLFDRKIQVKDVSKNTKLPRLPLGWLWLKTWHLFGHLLRKSDMLIYLISEK